MLQNFKQKYHLCYEMFHLFAKDRNHIMHNKLIDRTAYLQINNLAETIEKDLVLAISLKAAKDMGNGLTVKLTECMKTVSRSVRIA